jgi:hypothetical protein
MKHSDFRSPLIYGISLDYKPENFTFKTSYARGFRAPSLKQLYLQFIDNNHEIHGNEDLKPEMADNFTFSADYVFVRNRHMMGFEAGLFYNNIRDAVQLAISTSQPGWGKYFNVDREYSTKGFEAAINYRYSPGVFLNASFVNTGRSRLDDPGEFFWSFDFTSSAGWTLKNPGLQFAAYYKYNDAYLEFAGNYNQEGQLEGIAQQKTSGYHILDVTALKKIFRNKIIVSAGVKNLLNVTKISSLGNVDIHGSIDNDLSAAYGRTLFLSASYNFSKRVMPYPGEITTISDSVQTYQSWFDLESGNVTVNRVSDWDLAVESYPAGWRVRVNSGADWFIHNTQKLQFPSTDQMPSLLNGLYDNQQLWPDSTATGKWNLHNYTYLLAKYVNGKFTDFKHLQFMSYTDSTFVFRYISGDSETDTVLIVKDQEANFSYYSFDKKSQVYPEPDKNAYDLVFTSYYDMPTLFGQTIPYKVGGVLLNIWNTSAVLDTVHSFEELSRELIPLVDFSDRVDVPGYNWKDVSVDITGGGSASYTVKSNFNYIIRTAQGNYFRMRFLSYTLDGRSGYPRFEFSMLQ